jgi:hypothetical protein
MALRRPMRRHEMNAALVRVRARLVKGPSSARSLRPAHGGVASQRVPTGRTGESRPRTYCKGLLCLSQESGTRVRGRACTLHPHAACRLALARTSPCPCHLETRARTGAGHARRTGGEPTAEDKERWRLLLLLDE